MNMMSDVLVSLDKVVSADEMLMPKIARARAAVLKNKIKFTDSWRVFHGNHYYVNALPIVSEHRDVLKKSNSCCQMRINWKNKPVQLDKPLSPDMLKPQWGWVVETVDVEHTRNNFRNKETFWCVYDTETKAMRYLEVFNMMFRTCLEQDTIDEYKRFKQKPEKRPLTYDKILSTAHELYAMVDRGED